MGDSLRYKDWFEKAAHDLRGAEILMEHDGGNDLVAFHCQQAMEKMLKGWLLKMTGELLDGHSLVFLCRKATAAGAPLKGNLRDCAYVNQFYIETAIHLTLICLCPKRKHRIVWMPQGN